MRVQGASSSGLSLDTPVWRLYKDFKRLWPILAKLGSKLLDRRYIGFQTEPASARHANTQESEEARQATRFFSTELGCLALYRALRRGAPGMFERTDSRAFRKSESRYHFPLEDMLEV